MKTGALIRSEILADPAPRIAQYGGQAVPQYSHPTRQVYWTARYKVWIVVTPDPSGGQRLSYYNCGCGS